MLCLPDVSQMSTVSCAFSLLSFASCTFKLLKTCNFCLNIPLVFLLQFRSRRLTTPQHRREAARSRQTQRRLRRRWPPPPARSAPALGWVPDGFGWKTLTCSLSASS